VQDDERQHWGSSQTKKHHSKIFGVTDSIGNKQKLNELIGSETYRIASQSLHHKPNYQAFQSSLAKTTTASNMMFSTETETTRNEVED